MPLPGEQLRRRRARDALERDRNLLEGALSSRLRRGLARGGVLPSSEAESRSRGCATLERGVSSPEGATGLRGGEFVSGRCRTPRAKRSSARGWLGRLCGGPWVRGFVSRVCLGSFAFVCYGFKRVLPGCLGDPYGCPRHNSPVTTIRVTLRKHSPVPRHHVTPEMFSQVFLTFEFNTTC
jgi:hypothetical protein